MFCDAKGSYASWIQELDASTASDRRTRKYLNAIVEVVSTTNPNALARVKMGPAILCDFCA